MSDEKDSIEIFYKIVQKMDQINFRLHKVNKLLQLLMNLKFTKKDQRETCALKTSETLTKYIFLNLSCLDTNTKHITD